MATFHSRHMGGWGGEVESSGRGPFFKIFVVANTKINTKKKCGQSIGGG